MDSVATCVRACGITKGYSLWLHAPLDVLTHVGAFHAWQSVEGARVRLQRGRQRALALRTCVLLRVAPSLLVSTILALLRCAHVHLELHVDPLHSPLLRWGEPLTWFLCTAATFLITCWLALEAQAALLLPGRHTCVAFITTWATTATLAGLYAKLALLDPLTCILSDASSSSSSSCSGVQLRALGSWLRTSYVADGHLNVVETNFGGGWAFRVALPNVLLIVSVFFLWVLAWVLVVAAPLFGSSRAVSRPFIASNFLLLASAFLALSKVDFFYALLHGRLDGTYAPSPLSTRIPVCAIFAPLYAVVLLAFYHTVVQEHPRSSLTRSSALGYALRPSLWDRHFFGAFDQRVEWTSFRHGLRTPAQNEAFTREISHAIRRHEEFKAKRRHAAAESDTQGKEEIDSAK